MTGKIKTLFEVYGPFKVPCRKGKASKTITKDEVSSFWNQHPAHKDKKGCYVFSMRAGKGITPYYVGKATKSFKQEIFTPHKLNYYHQALSDSIKGTPVLFFLSLPAKKGKANVKHIGKLEKFLIQSGVMANPDLLNIQGKKQETWGISGIVRQGKGTRSKSAKAFKQCMDL